jgi:NAD(P)-dependent dehydrogenase (short-subunit alcohol dehydrogenase family)
MDAKPLQGKVALVTGANSGIGRVTALELARAGATLVCVCRDEARGAQAVAELRSESGNPDVELLLADLSSQKSIRALAAAVKTKHAALHVLVNNAGVVIPERRVTVDGIENTFALNHLGYFLLTSLLLDVLEASAPARIVNVASEASRMGTMDWDDLQMNKKYSAMGAYGRSKLANIMFTYDLAERLEGTGVTVNAAHPGPVRTRFGEELRGLWGLVWPIARPFMRTPEQGARTVVYLAMSPEASGKTGLYWADEKPIRSVLRSYDAAAKKRLWQESERLIGAPF